MRAIRPRLILATIASATLWTRTAAAEPAAPASSLADVMRQTAVVVEGNVEDVSFRYDELEGPRTVATLSNLTIHLGSLGGSTPQSIELRSFGGFLPDGREVIATHVPSLAPGKRYVVFLRNTDWTLSPIAFGYALRVETLGAAHALVDPFGRLVSRVSRAGLVPGPQLFVRDEEGLASPGTERRTTWVTESDVVDALDASELADALRSFAEATDAWPGGSFSQAPTTSALSWRRVLVTPAAAMPEADASNTEEELLACFGPPAGATDATSKDLAVCEDDGGAP